MPRCLIAAFIFFLSLSEIQADIWSEAEHGYADNNGTKIHYATTGSGPLVIMIHGFPDFWYSWRHQMEGLRGEYKVVAIDQRGYNLSDQPAGDENYAMPNMISDVAAVIRHFGEEKAIIVGHDWGGVVAWSLAFARPDLVDKLVILNLPHPNGLARVQRSNNEARANTNYARVFQQGKPEDPDIFFGGPMNAQSLSSWVTDPAARKHYIKAFEKSDFKRVQSL